MFELREGNERSMFVYMETGGESKGKRKKLRKERGRAIYKNFGHRAAMAKQAH